MLNGKFFSGLPPKMMERTAGTPNRLESHLFWPDDTRVETAHETRSKRRSSLQTNEAPREGITTYQRQSSWTANGVGSGGGIGGEDAVDTKQRFHKEFAKSSIQFFDNIQEEDYGNRKISQAQARRNHKHDITTKPTAIKMQLPNNNTTQDEYAAIKKKQTFASKIQFFDYVDDANAEGERRSNRIKPKMDMNDKKEVERHTKNSPKLQVKGIDRNLRMAVDERRNNERERKHEMENGRDHNAEYYDMDMDRSRSGAHIIRNDMRADVNSNSRNSRRQQQVGKSYGSPTRRQANYRNDYEENNYEDVERRSMPRVQSMPKKILKNPNNIDRAYSEDYNDYNNGYENELEHLTQTTRNMRMRDTPRKQVTYGDDIYEQETNHNSYDDENDMQQEYGHSSRKSSFRTANGNEAAITTHNTRTETKTMNRSLAGRNEQRRPSPSASTDTQDHDRIERVSPRSVSLNKTNNQNHFNKNNENLKLNNQHQQHQQQNRSTPKMSLSLRSTPTPISAASDRNESPTSPTLDSQKHLRSSLCFHGGEIVANNKNRESTPTSESNARPRTARSAATSRRICVGLPD